MILIQVSFILKYLFFIFILDPISLKLLSTSISKLSISGIQYLFDCLTIPTTIKYLDLNNFYFNEFQKKSKINLIE